MQLGLGSPCDLGPFLPAEMGVKSGHPFYLPYIRESALGESRSQDVSVIANRLSRVLLLGLPLAFAGCGGESLTLPSEGEPAAINIVSGNQQQGRVGSTLDAPLVVKVTDTRDRPVAGASVVFEFTDTGGGGDATPASTTTDANGQASAQLRLGAREGQVNGTARVPVAGGTTPVQIAFTATALSDNANGISLVSGDNQTGAVNTVLTDSLVVKVSDAFGNPIPGVTIAWSVTGGGSVSEASTQTGADGQTAVQRTLGAAPAPRPRWPAPTAWRDPRSRSPTPRPPARRAGSRRCRATARAPWQDPSWASLVVKVLDSENNPIPNRAVSWVVGAGGGSVAPPTGTTDGQGLASARWTMGPAAGSNTLNAVVSGVGIASFTATATAGSPNASNSTVSAAPDHITAGGTSTITVTVRDGGNNPVAGASVTLASSGTGNTINPASASTNAAGVATFAFSSTVAEAKTITATAGGVVLDQTATVSVGKANSTTRITSDEPDASIVNDDVRVEYTVTGSGGGTPTGTVTVTVSGGTETCSGTVADGFCSIKLVVPGNRRQLTATYSGDERFNGSSDNENHRVNAPVANNPPVAAFSSSCTALACQFTDGSSDDKGVTSWSWNFGDVASGANNTSTTQSPPHTFSAAGTYTVTLIVSDAEGATSTKTNTVTVSAANNPPVAGFTAPSCTALACQFTDGSTDDSDGNRREPELWRLRHGAHVERHPKPVVTPSQPPAR